MAVGTPGSPAPACAPHLPSPPPPVVAPLAPSDVPAVLALLGAEFERELAGVGLTPAAWSALEAGALAGGKWGVVGVAREAATAAADPASSSPPPPILGVVVLQPPAVAARRPGSTSLPSLARAAGVRVALRVLARDLLLPETVFPGETLIEFLAVHPGARRRGVGRALLAWARRAAAAGVEAGAAPRPACLAPPALTLWVAADNAAALALYRAAGFAAADDTDRAGVLTRAAAAFFLGRRRYLRLVAAVEGGGAGQTAEEDAESVTPTSVLEWRGAAW